MLRRKNMDTREEKIIFKDPYGNKELEREFNEKIIKICDTKLSRKDFIKKIRDTKKELMKKYGYDKGHQK